MFGYVRFCNAAGSPSRWLCMFWCRTREPIGGFDSEWVQRKRRQDQPTWFLCSGGKKRKRQLLMYHLDVSSDQFQHQSFVLTRAVKVRPPTRSLASKTTGVSPLARNSLAALRPAHLYKYTIKLRIEFCVTIAIQLECVGCHMRNKQKNWTQY